MSVDSRAHAHNQLPIHGCLKDVGDVMWITLPHLQVKQRDFAAVCVTSPYMPVPRTTAVANDTLLAASTCCSAVALVVA